MRIIQNGLLISGDRATPGDLAIEDGVITAIDRHIEAKPGDEMIDARDLFVFPGFIDAHTHFDMASGDLVTADNFESGTRAAIAGGTTTIVDFATQTRGDTLREGLERWHAKADGQCSCDYGFHMAITDWNDRTARELPAMFKAGVTSFKLYLAYDALRVSDRAVYEILREMKRLGGMTGVHCENGDLVDALVAEERAGGNLTPSAHPLSRPPYVEAEAISRLLYIASLAFAAVNIVHLSSAAGLKEVRKARSRGQKVYVETCPQYLLLDDRRYDAPGVDGAKFICSPPLRAPSDRKALATAMLTGEVDTIATDHCSYTLAQKSLGASDFSKAPNGLPGVEHRAAAIWTQFVHGGALSPSGFCRLMAETPAKLYGMYPRKGALKVGSDADIVLWDPRARGVIRAETQLQRADYTPYEGLETVGGCHSVLLRGETVAQGGAVTRPRQGQYVAREAVSI